LWKVEAGAFPIESRVHKGHVAARTTSPCGIVIASGDIDDFCRAI
jgi:hypothetical protein